MVFSGRKLSETPLANLRLGQYLYGIIVSQRFSDPFHDNRRYCRHLFRKTYPGKKLPYLHYRDNPSLHRHASVLRKDIAGHGKTNSGCVSFDFIGKNLKKLCFTTYKIKK
jgi:hypothetical protein